jgi:hypothetical protein
VLSSGPRDAPERHRTLRATIEWSHRLLDDIAATVFRRLSVFAGGATISAAEAVCGERALDGIAGLLEASLLRRVEDPDGELRVAMLETLREFAAERLAADKEDAHDVVDRHAAFFVGLADAHAQATFAASREAADRRLAAEIDNVRTAHDRLMGTAPEAALRLIAPTWFYWESVGPISEGRRRLAVSLQRARGDTATRAHALIGAAALDFAIGDLDAAEQVVGEALDLLRGDGDQALLAHAFARAQTLAALRGDQAARRDYAEQALEASLRTGNERVIALATNNLADTYMREDPDRAVALLQSVLEGTPDRYAVLFARGNLAELALAAGRLDDARELVDLAMADVRILGIDRTEVWLLSTVASIALASGDDVQARTAIADAAALQARVGTRQFLPELLLLAATLAAPADPAVAARALALVRPLGLETAYAEQLRDSLASELSATLGEEALAEAMRTGEALALEDALLETLAVIESH